MEFIVREFWHKWNGEKWVTWSHDYTGFKTLSAAMEWAETAGIANQSSFLKKDLYGQVTEIK